MTATTPPIRAVIIDRHADSRHRLVQWLNRETGFGVSGEFAGLEDVVAFIRTSRPHVLFIRPDDQGPDAFESLASIPAAVRPLAVFVDGSPADAPRAFELDAVDFIVKPLTAERLALAVERVRRRLATPRVPAVLPVTGSRLPIRVRGRILLLPVDTIRSIHARNVQSEIHTTDGVHRVNQSLGDLAARLPADRFLRIHRSTVVQVTHVRQLRPKAHGDGMVVMDDGRELPFSRSHRRALREALFPDQRGSEARRANAA